MTDERPTHLDLFSGIGGFTLAFEKAGFRTVAFSEINPTKRIILDHWFPDIPNVGDIKKLARRAHDCVHGPEYTPDDPQPWCQLCEQWFADCPCVGADEFSDSYGFPDVITGGVPCQPASALGLMRGTLDPRWLWPEVLRVLGELRPRFGVFENPPALLTLEDGRAFNGIVSGLVSLGYDCWWDVFPAAAFGAGHLRDRVLLVVTDASSPSQPRECRILPAPQSQSPRNPAQPGYGDRGQTHSLQYLLKRVSGPDWWHEAHTGIPVLSDGLSSKLVEAINLCAGDSVVPQVLAPIAQILHSVLRPR